MSGVLRRTWEEESIACLKVLPWYLSGEAEDNHEGNLRNTIFLSRDSN
jgi:hypothetical protein